MFRQARRLQERVILSPQAKNLSYRADICAVRNEWPVETRWRPATGELLVLSHVADTAGRGDVFGNRGIADVLNASRPADARIQVLADIDGDL
jgi:hypothetical protein